MFNEVLLITKWSCHVTVINDKCFKKMLQEIKFNFFGSKSLIYFHSFSYFFLKEAITILGTF